MNGYAFWERMTNDWWHRHVLGEDDPHPGSLSSQELEFALKQFRVDEELKREIDRQFDQIVEQLTQARRLDDHLTELMLVRGIERGYVQMEVPHEDGSSTFYQIGDYYDWTDERGRRWDKPMIGVDDLNQVRVLYPSEVLAAVKKVTDGVPAVRPDLRADPDRSLESEGQGDNRQQ